MSHSMWLAHNNGDEFLDLFSGTRPILEQGYWSGALVPGCTWLSRIAPGSISIVVPEGECAQVELVPVVQDVPSLAEDVAADPEQPSTIVTSTRLAELTSANTP